MDNELNEHHGREPYYEDEIDLYQLIQVLLKRKKLIVGVFLVAVIVAIAASYIMKPVYRVSAVIGPAQIYELEAVQNSVIWRETDVDTPANIDAIVSQNPFHYEILRQLDWDIHDSKNKYDVKSKLEQNTKYISISIDSAEPERAKEYLEVFLAKINAFYYPKVKTNVELLNNTIKRIINEKQGISSQIELLQSKLDTLEKEDIKLKKQIDEVQNRNTQTLNQHDKILAKESNPDSMTPLLLYSNVMQENLTQIDKILNNMRENNKIQREDLQQDIKDLKVELANLDVQLKNLESKLAVLGVKANPDTQDGQSEDIEVSGIKIIQEPTVDPQRVSPKRTLMVAVAGVLGLFVGIFAAFAAEFWQSHKVSA